VGPARRTSEIVKRVETSNDPAFGTTGAKLREALGSLDRASRWLLGAGHLAPNDALAARPLSQAVRIGACGCVLAGEALAARDLGEAAGDLLRYVTLRRFFAEQHLRAGGIAANARNRQRRGGERRGCGFAGLTLLPDRFSQS